MMGCLKWTQRCKKIKLNKKKTYLMPENGCKAFASFSGLGTFTRSKVKIFLSNIKQTFQTINANTDIVCAIPFF